MKKLILICMLALVVLLVGCKKEVEIVPEAPVVEEPVVGGPVVEEPVVEVTPPVVVETVSELEMITEARCIDNKISLTLTNPTDEDIVLAKTAKVILNGLVVADPECDTLEIAAGESVFCEDISGHFAIRQGTQNTIQINMKSERGLSIVDCSE